MRGFFPTVSCMPKTKSPAPQQHHQLAIHTLVSTMPWDTVEKSAKFQTNSATCSLLCWRLFCSPRVLLCRIVCLLLAFASASVSCRRAQSVVSSSVPPGYAVTQSCSRAYLQHHSTAQCVRLRNWLLHGSSSSSSSSSQQQLTAHLAQLTAATEMGAPMEI